ncbi:MAG: response regulator transcription factor [Spirochaetes bacterium]|nr:response regulator transcription factor [Spirochaetota bacterium]
MARKIIIIEDDGQVNKALAERLRKNTGYTLQATFQKCEDALPFLARGDIWLTILDLGLPGLSGAGAVKAVKKANPEGEILIHSIYDGGDEIFGALQAGASGYLLKGCNSVELTEALRQLEAGGAPMSYGIARKVAGFFGKLVVRKESEPEGSPENPLSERESAILARLSEGYSYKDIAQIAGISVHTVHTHIKNIYRKLKVNSRAEAVYRHRKHLN